jgi:hypothetical protein
MNGIDIGTLIMGIKRYRGFLVVMQTGEVNGT